MTLYLEVLSAALMVVFRKLAGEISEGLTKFEAILR